MTRKTKQTFLLCDTPPTAPSEPMKPHHSDEWADYWKLGILIPSPYLSLIFEQVAIFLFLVTIHGEGALAASARSRIYNPAKLPELMCHLEPSPVATLETIRLPALHTKNKPFNCCLQGFWEARGTVLPCSSTLFTPFGGGKGNKMRQEPFLSFASSTSTETIHDMYFP